jgi:hypothetical protein
VAPFDANDDRIAEEQDLDHAVMKDHPGEEPEVRRLCHHPDFRQREHAHVPPS